MSVSRPPGETALGTNSSGFVAWLTALLESLRPRQWLKNLLLFAGVIFSRNLTDVELLLKSLLAFALFCLITSAVYLINDAADIEADRLHPRKRHRPLASGRLSVPAAAVLAAALAALGVGGAFWLDLEFGLISAGYFALMLLYTAGLKRLATVDVVIIAVGFVARAVAGAAVVNVVISPWLVICTTFLALFLAVSKRRHELLTLGDEARSHRRALADYSPSLLDQFTAVATTSAILTYALYTLSERTIHQFGTDQLVWTVPLVVLAVFRYLYLVHQKQLGGSPEVLLLTDRPLQAMIVCWALLVLLIIY
ncbi:MAG: decaprenyl-phosphate phosphoribosyltransferase [Acidobacteria bacterium]|nr:decaprenyl-phosphate phosphoribosyltransferase [Acidobacteriota bacterium]